MSDPRTDRTVLTTRQYATGANLAARAALYHWQQPAVNFPEWVLNHRQWSSSDRALDVGCGYGAYLAALRRRTNCVVGLDFAAGILVEARTPGATLVNADAQALPFPADSFDVALAAHMLYHVPDIAAAVAELRRVVVDGGDVLVATNGPDDKPELLAVLHQAAGKPPGTYRKTDARFLLDHAVDALGRAFGEVRLTHIRTEMVVPSVEPVLSYVESIRTAAEPALGVEWQDLMLAVRELVLEEIERAGSFQITTHAGVALAS